VQTGCLSDVYVRVFSALALCCSLGRALGMFVGDTLFQSLQSATFCNTYLRVAPSDTGIMSLGRESYCCRRFHLYCVIMVALCNRADHYIFAVCRGGFRHVQHVRPNRALQKRGVHKRTGKFFQHSNIAMSDNLNNFVTLNSSYSTTSVLCAYNNYVMRVLNNMSMMTTLSLCMSCEFSRAVFVY